MDFVKKIELFLIGDFHRNHIRKDRVSKLWKEKNDSKRKKLKFKKKTKKWTFPKGLVHGFSPKIKFSLITVFHRNCQKRLFLDNLNGKQ